MFEKGDICHNYTFLQITMTTKRKYISKYITKLHGICIIFYRIRKQPSYQRITACTYIEFMPLVKTIGTVTLLIYTTLKHIKNAYCITFQVNVPSANIQYKMQISNDKTFGE